MLAVEDYDKGKRPMSAYLILDITLHDFAAFSEYIQQIPRFIAKHAGRYLVQGVEPVVLEGDWQPERVVVIEFPSKKNAQDFLNDSDAQTLFAIRHRTTTSKLLLVEGCQ